MADESFIVRLEFDARQPEQAMQAMSRAAGQARTAILGTEQATDQYLKTLRNVERNAAKGAAGITGTGKAAKDLTQSLSTTRYALYDVANAVGIAGVAMVALAGATYAVGIAWERDFADVIRTSGATGDAVDELRGKFVKLAQDMPVSFADLTDIGTLGAQLGIATDQLDEFTSVTARFSATTGVAVEASATAFGRLDSLLPDVKGNFEALGSSILRVGVNSVATEDQIIKTAQQIASMGQLAGLSADEVVGLSGALASLGIPPELSRSVITTSFTKIITAVTKGGEKLEAFGKAAGMSGREFAEAWRSDAIGTFSNLLGRIAGEGEQGVQTLDSLGLASQRLTPTLLKLGQNTDILASALRDAAGGFNEQSDLSAQYAIIAETTAAKLQVLANNFQALLATLSSGNLGPFRELLDFLTGILKIATDIAANPVGGWILGLVLNLTLLSGVALLVMAGFTRMAAGAIALQQGFTGIAAIAPRTVNGILGVGAASRLASGQMTAGAVSAKLLGTALKALSLIGLLLVLPDIATWAQGAIDAMRGFDASATGAFGRAKASAEDLERVANQNEFQNWITEVTRGFNNIPVLGDLGISDFDRDIRTLDRSLAELANGGNAAGAFEGLKKYAADAGVPLEDILILFPDVVSAIKQGGGEIKNGMLVAGEGTNSFNEAINGIEGTAEEAKAALDELKEAMLNIGNTSISAQEGVDGVQSALNKMAEAAEADGASLYGLNDQSIALRASMIDVEESARVAAQAIIDNGGDVNTVARYYANMRQKIIDQRVAMGESAAAARAWADKVLGPASDVEQGLREVADAAKKADASDVNINVTTSGAEAARRTLQNLLRTSTGNRSLHIAAGAGGAGGLTRASGGPVYGPGSGTSDSIPAWLSNGEYVIKASAVRALGLGYLNAVNQGRRPQKYATGGLVGNGGGSTAIGTGIMELGPKSLGRLGGQAPQVNVYLDDVAIARAADRGNKKLRGQGA